MEETNIILLQIVEELKGIRKELDYNNGVEVLKDGTKMGRSRWNEIMNTSNQTMKNA